MRKTKLTQGHRANMGDPTGVHIRRTWGDVPVVDAAKELRVFIAPEDLEGASPKDPAYCVFARACRRTFHATKVLFFRSVAYVELPDQQGRRRVERFIMGDSMRGLIESFDRGEGVIPEGGFVLKVPRPSRTLEVASRARAGRKAAARRRLEGRREATEVGKDGHREGPVLVDLSVRSGTGAVRFAGRTKAETS
jgi:hypothetical protein